MKSVLHLPHGDLRLPNFLPDATLGVVRNVDSSDLEQCGIEALVMNTFHLMQRPGSSTINALGGLHKMCGWQHPITTDSGGFQAYSLIRQNAKYGYMNDKGITFQPENSDRKFHLTPEKSIQLQVSYGADIVVCLDDCTHVDDPFETQQESVQRTIAWAKRCKEEFLRLMKQKRLAAEQQPLLFGVIQGGGFLELRKQCADALREIGFDGYGFGGWPLDNKGNLLTEIVQYTRELVREWPMHALGVGHPANVVASTAPCPHGTPGTFAYMPLQKQKVCPRPARTNAGFTMFTSMTTRQSRIRGRSRRIVIASVVAGIRWPTCIISTKLTTASFYGSPPCIICASWHNSWSV